MARARHAIEATVTFSRSLLRNAVCIFFVSLHAHRKASPLNLVVRLGAYSHLLTYSLRCSLCRTSERMRLVFVVFVKKKSACDVMVTSPLLCMCVLYRAGGYFLFCFRSVTSRGIFIFYGRQTCFVCASFVCREVLCCVLILSNKKQVQFLVIWWPISCGGAIEALMCHLTREQTEALVATTAAARPSTQTDLSYLLALRR